MTRVPDLLLVEISRDDIRLPLGVLRLKDEESSLGVHQVDHGVHDALEDLVELLTAPARDDDFMQAHELEVHGRVLARIVDGFRRLLLVPCEGLVYRALFFTA